jgi:23S rRNA pseudouridine1911/1915/1917 synthase
VTTIDLPLLPSLAPDSDDNDESLDDSAEALSDKHSLPPGADPTIDWGLDCHLTSDGQPKIIERKLAVKAEHSGLRLDHFIKTQIPRLSRTKIQAVIVESLQRVVTNDEDHNRPASSSLRPNTKVAAGENYILRRHARAEPPCPRNIAIAYQDDDVMVIDKPAGLPVHSTAKFYFNTLTRIMLDTMGEGLQLCHRLDRETSGLVVVAKNKSTASLIKQAFAAKTVRKTYVAVVVGHPSWPVVDSGDEFVVDAPLRLSEPGDRTELVGVRMITDGRGQPSKTKFSIIATSNHYTLLRCRPVTGRQHQIRAHLAFAGFPIVGDKIYTHGDRAFIEFCDRGWTPELATRFVLWRQALHAAEVDFPHPDGTRRVVSSTIAKDMADLLASDPLSR